MCFQVSRAIGLPKPLYDVVVAEIELQEVKDVLKKNSTEALDTGVSVHKKMYILRHRGMYTAGRNNQTTYWVGRYTQERLQRFHTGTYELKCAESFHI